ncbi:MAG: hypothetical protein J07AB43_12610 [Candidatus Nanosalina sp. J07AB43]|jgi:hypothetical protein|nr:MAG: hypothetical protein J07AB43_12610 [Candidatus Nanosalina sp. J07AB43]
MLDETGILTRSDRYDLYTLNHSELGKLDTDYNDEINSAAALYDRATNTMYLNPGFEAEMEITEYVREDQDGRVKILGKDSWQSDCWWNDVLDRSRSHEIGSFASEDLIESYDLM